MRVPGIWTVFALGLLACHSTTSFLNGDELSGAPKGPAALPCNNLEQQGPEVALSGSQERAPAPEGGMIVDGTYVLTSSVLYTHTRSHGAKLVEMGRITMRVNGATSELVRSGVDGRERRSTVSRVNEGHLTKMHTTCASPTNHGDTTSTTPYTATDTTLTFITPGPAGTVVATYTRL